MSSQYPGFSLKLLRQLGYAFITDQVEMLEVLMHVATQMIT